MKNPISKLRIQQFEKLLSKLKQFSSPTNEDEETLFIKNFEIAYELTFKTLFLIYLASNSQPLPTKKDVIRWAFKFKLIKNTDDWFNFIDIRNETVHEYLANEIYARLPLILKFLPNFKYLISKLKKVNENSTF